MRASLTLVVVLPMLACTNPAATAELAQQLQDIGDAIAETRGEASSLRSELDSLRGVVARQDTVLRQLSSMAGVPYTR